MPPFGVTVMNPPGVVVVPLLNSPLTVTGVCVPLVAALMASL